MMLYESFLSSPHRTNNPDEADYFVVPLLGACLMQQADDNPRIALQNYVRTVLYCTFRFLFRPELSRLVMIPACLKDSVFTGQFCMLPRLSRTMLSLFGRQRPLHVRGGCRREPRLSCE